MGVRTSRASFFSNLQQVLSAALRTSKRSLRAKHCKILLRMYVAFLGRPHRLRPFDRPFALLVDIQGPRLWPACDRDRSNWHRCYLSLSETACARSSESRWWRCTRTPDPDKVTVRAAYPPSTLGSSEGPPESQQAASGSLHGVPTARSRPAGTG